MTDKASIRIARALWPLRVWYLATWCLAAPLHLVWLLLHRRMGADPQRFGERLGHPSHNGQVSVIWFHAASLGEVAQIRPLTHHFAQRGQTVLVTTTTQAGADWVAKNLPAVIHQFVPMDTAHAVDRFLSAWSVDAAIFVEGDFSPRLTLAVQERGIPLALLNARHSRTRERLPAVFAALLTGFDLITCRSETVASSIRALGVPEGLLRVLPDLRIAAQKLSYPEDALTALRTQIGSRPVWLAASTHQSDESIVLDAHQAVTGANPNALLIVAPRHPMRGAPLESGARARGFNVARRAENGSLLHDTQVYIADTLGELGVFFSLAPVTFLGGSFGDEGGHNPYEPASFGTALLTGPRVKNFADAFDALCHAGAVEIVQTPGELGPQVMSLLQTGKAQSMGAAGQRFMNASETGLTDTIDLLTETLGI